VEIFASAFDSWADKYSDLFTTEVFGLLMGLLERNAIATVAVAGSDDDPVLAEGLGLYKNISVINHSCYPNAALLKQPGDLDDRTSVITIRDIKAGEEVVISYIDEDAPRLERQSQLKDYGFVCKCEACLSEDLQMELF
jgi:hypothetical protein